MIGQIVKMVLGYVGPKVVTGFLKPLIKSKAKAVVRSEGDKLELEVARLYEMGGIAAVHAHVDTWQANMKAKIKGSWIPDFLEDKMLGLLADGGKFDVIQAQLEEKARTEGLEGIHDLFDRAQAGIIAKIDSW